MSDDKRARLETIVRAAPSLMRVLATARALALPDWLIFSGAVYQPVWNHLTGRASDYHSHLGILPRSPRLRTAVHPLSDRPRPLEAQGSASERGHCPQREHRHQAARARTRAPAASFGT